MDWRQTPSFVKKHFRPGTAGFYILLTTCFALLVIFGSNALARRQLQVVLPEAFIEARREAAGVSKDIVELTNSVNDSIKKINLAHVAERSDAIFAVITDAKEKNGAAHAQAFELSRSLQGMTEALVQIPSAPTQRLAYTAIATELALVSEFLTYTEKLGEFLESIERAFAKRSTAEEQKVISTALDEVNASTKTINRLNDEFLAKMKLFDKSL